MKKQSQQKEKTCADKVQGKYEKLVQEFIEAQRYYDIEETERYSPENTDLSYYDDFFEYINNRGLSFER